MSQEGLPAEQGGEIVVYEAPDGAISVDVTVSDGTVWLTQRQMADLFSTTVANVNLHINNLYDEGELSREATIKESLIVRIEGSRQVRRRIQQFNLDVIISMGYRVKSVRGTQFRIWANGILRDHLLRGYTLNAHRLTALGVDAAELVELITRILSSREALSEEGRGVLEVANRYALTWTLLRAYDERTVPAAPAGITEPIVALTVEDARAILRALVEDTIAAGQLVGLFGLESGDRLEAALMSVEQTWNGQALYATVESRAAHLLYFLVKDHPLVDGNKRAGALLFIEYLHRNGALMTGLGEPRIANTTLATLTLMIAESSPDHMDFMIRLVLNAIAGT